MSKVIVIGSGLGGLAAACTLAARGYAVTVFEQNDWVGGKAGRLTAGEFRFDLGPTLLVAPSVLQVVFQEAGQRMEDHLELVRLDPQWRAFFADRSVLDLSENLAQMKDNLREFTRVVEDVDNYELFLLECQRLHKFRQDYVFWRPVGRVQDIAERHTLTDLRNSLQGILKSRPHQSVSECVREFVKDERTAQMLEHLAQTIGSSPQMTPAVFCGLAHLQTHEGLWHPVGGMFALAQALRTLGERLGVEFLTGKRIATIKRSQDNRVLGVVDQNGHATSAGAVISNMDTVRTHRELLNGYPMTRFAARREYEPSCSGVRFYFGLKKRYHHLAHHNLVFSSDPEKESRCVYELGEPAPDPTLYIAAPAITEPAVAPLGGEALSVLVHTPYLRSHHDWLKLLPKYRKAVFDKLARSAGMDDLEERIVVEHVVTPQDISDQFNTFQGALYGLASHGKVHGAFKPSNRSPDVVGLYLAGSSAHPGPGVPMALMSGWIAADALDSDGVAEKVR